MGKVCDRCVFSENCSIGRHYRGSICDKFEARKNGQSANKPGRQTPEPQEYTAEPSIPFVSHASAPHRSKYTKLKQGQRLWYKNKFTGVVEYGVVAQLLHNVFTFNFKGRSVVLPYSVIGKRVFRTWDEASRKEY